jgi:hypothetical protein
MAGLGLTLAACGGASGDETTEASASSTNTGTDGTTNTPTTSGPTSGATDTGDGSLTGSVSDTEILTTSGESTITPDSETQSVDPSTEGTSSTSTGADTSTGTDTSTGADTSTGDTSSEGGESSSTGDTNGCVPTEMMEVTCDAIDNDCNGNVDDIDIGKDGICDCLNIGILGTPGYAPNADFEAWLEDQGSSVTRTLLQNNPGVVTPAFLDKYDLVLLDRIERALSAEEAAALAAFVKDEGRGLITLIGYNFDNQNPAPERDRANSALSSFGLAYQGPYFGDNVVPTFDPNHPVSKDIADVNFNGGIEPVDLGMQGTSTVFATYQAKNAGIAHQTAMNGGRVIVWGDEWITFDSVWQGYVDVEAFWVNMVDWARPQDICALPQ